MADAEVVQVVQDVAKVNIEGKEVAQALPDNFVGKWLPETVHNVDEYLKAQGVNWAKRQIIKQLGPLNKAACEFKRAEVEVNGKKYEGYVMECTEPKVMTHRIAWNKTVKNPAAMGPEREVEQTARVVVQEGVTKVIIEHVDGDKTGRIDRYINDKGKLVIENHSGGAVLTRILKRAPSEKKKGSAMPDN